MELTQILEKAGTKIAVREERSGPIEKLNAYAWVTLRSVAASWRRLGSNKLRENSVGYEASHAIFGAAHAQEGTPEQIERRVLLREAMAHLTEDERSVVDYKLMGFSAEEIAKTRGSSTAAVNMVFSRAKQKLARELAKSTAARPIGAMPKPAGSQTPRGPTEPMANERQPPDPSGFEAENEIDLVLGEAYANPNREGCPPRELLIALARRERPIGDPAYKHLFQCSPCCREAPSLQQAAGERREGFEPSAHPRRRWLAAAAALVLIGGAVAWLLLSSTGVVAPDGVPPPPSDATLSAELDLRKDLNIVLACF